MEKHPYRALLIGAAIVLALIAIYPTLGWMALSPEKREARLEAWAEQDAERMRTEPNMVQKAWWKVERWAQFDRDWVITLGLDLQGGVHMVVGFDPDDPTVREQMEARNLDEEGVQEIVLQRVQNRVDEFEAQEPVIQKLGDRQVQIQLPGEKDVQRAQNLIMRTAFLTFHIVAGPDETNRVFRAIDQHSNNAFVPFLNRPLLGGAYEVSPENFEHVRDIVAQAEQAPGVIPENRMVAFSVPPKPSEQRGYSIYLLEREAGATGEGLTSAVARMDPQRPGQWQILFEFNTEGSQQFAQLTGDHINQAMAIVLDGRVVSAPNINDRIFGTGTIEGAFTRTEAADLAIALNSGSMPVPIREEYSGVVGPSLGRDAVQKGVLSSVIGFVIVMIFVVAYYRAGGIVVNIALLLNTLLMLALLAYFDATLTLPGIAGLILTVGMAVDANVLIFERMREELRLGKSLASAIEGAYARATVTILDANITTLIAAAVLLQFGTGPVKGFAVTLSIGVVTTLFTGVIVTRAVLDYAVRKKLITNLNMASWFKFGTHYDFMGKWRIGVAIPAVLIAIGMVAFIIRGDENFGVDFTQGTNIQLALNSEQPVTAAAIRERLAEAGFEDPTVQEMDQNPDLDHEFVIRIGVVELEATAEVAEGERPDTVSTRVQQALLPLTNNRGAAGPSIDQQVQLLEVQTVGPAVGGQLKRDALAAVFYSLLFIMAYLWFRFELKFSVAAMVALVHDVAVTLGVFALLGRELNIPVVAAILTIIGYSLNDTIVTFDRVRENLRINRGRNLSYFQLLNQSINETLSRTILTSLTTLFVVIVLFLFGGAAINSFALALLIGIVAGTFSTLYIACPVLLWWQQWRERQLTTPTRREDRQGARRPGKKKRKRPTGDEETATV